MKNKKGFTLIELLAVIVILAIIAIIATPIILNTIEDAKISAFKDSVSIAIRSSDLYTELNNIDLKEGISVTDLNLSHSDLLYGTIVLNNNQLEAVNISNGKYCASGNLGALTVYAGECDTTKPSAPGVDYVNEYSNEIEYTITQNGEISSGIKNYEYYLSDNELYSESDEENIIQSDENIITISDEGVYIHFRIVSVANKNGDWANIVNKIDATGPTIDNIVVENATATFDISDRELSNYQITTSNVEPTIWENDISGLTYSGTYTTTEVGTYYIYVKDSVGNVSYESFDITSVGIYVIKDGILQSGFSVGAVGIDTYGSSGGYYYTSDNDLSFYGVYINTDFTNYSTLKIYAKCSVVDGNHFGKVGYSIASNIYSGIRTPVQTTTLTEYNFDISGQTGTKSIVMGVYNDSNSATQIFNYVTNVILEP